MIPGLSNPERPPIRCVVFDFDGTLVQSNAIKRRAYFEAASALGDIDAIVTAVLAECAGDRGQNLAEIARRAQVAGVEIDTPVEALVAAYTRYCEEKISICPEVAGADFALRGLARRGLPLFVNSATPTDPLRVLIERRGWTSHFRGIFGAPQGKIDNLRATATHCGVAPAEILMVGDGEDDRTAARAFGCAFAGVVLDEPRFDGEADLVLSDLSGLPDFVVRWKIEKMAR
jgi:phosphoglycolate phosphatase-like HAD superfamily hydrolase